MLTPAFNNLLRFNAVRRAKKVSKLVNRLGGHIFVI
jgi:hypothetical protein